MSLLDDILNSMERLRDGQFSDDEEKKENQQKPVPSKHTRGPSGLVVQNRFALLDNEDEDFEKQILVQSQKKRAPQHKSTGKSRQAPKTTTSQAHQASSPPPPNRYWDVTHTRELIV